MLFVCFLMLVLAADAENEQITSGLEEIKSVLSAVNLRLDRIEDQQKITESIYSRHEEKFNCIANEKSASILWHKYTVWLINEQKTKDEGLETRQKSMMSKLNQLADNTDRCCQDNMTVTCVNPPFGSVANIQPAASPVRLTTQPTTTTTTQPPTTTTTQPPTTTPAQLYCKGLRDGVHKMKVGNEQIPVYCDDGFVTFQRRFTGEVNFDRTWAEYEQGFGNVLYEHWMGLRYLHEMTKDKSCTFRAKIAPNNLSNNKRNCIFRYGPDCDGRFKAIVARDFRVSSAAEKYKINVVFNQTDFRNPEVRKTFSKLNGQKFTTKDQDNDNERRMNCAAWSQLKVNGGFWYNKECLPSFPNSVFTDHSSACTDLVCGVWHPFVFKAILLQFSC